MSKNTKQDLARQDGLESLVAQLTDQGVEVLRHSSVEHLALSRECTCGCPETAMVAVSSLVQALRVHLIIRKEMGVRCSIEVGHIEGLLGAPAFLLLIPVEAFDAWDGSVLPTDDPEIEENLKSLLSPDADFGAEGLAECDDDYKDSEPRPDHEMSMTSRGFACDRLAIPILERLWEARVPTLCSCQGVSEETVSEAGAKNGVYEHGDSDEPHSSPGFVAIPGDLAALRGLAIMHWSCGDSWMLLEYQGEEDCHEAGPEYTLWMPPMDEPEFEPDFDGPVAEDLADIVDYHRNIGALT